MEGRQAGDHAGGAWLGCGCAALQRACHGPQLHAVVSDGRVRDVAGPPLLLLQAHGGDASAPPHVRDQGDCLDTEVDSLAAAGARNSSAKRKDLRACKEGLQRQQPVQCPGMAGQLHTMDC